MNSVLGATDASVKTEDKPRIPTIPAAVDTNEAESSLSKKSGVVFPRDRKMKRRLQERKITSNRRVRTK